MMDAQSLEMLMNPGYSMPGRRDQGFFGFYRGIVEYNKDPLKIGRVKVRVQAIHGSNTDTVPTEKLRWAPTAERVCGGGRDMGSFDPPPVGATVGVVFEGGNPEFPVVLCSYNAIPCQPQEMNTVTGRELTEQAEDIGGTWETPPATTVPEECKGQDTPTRHCVFKSLKGHAIWYEDKDDAEAFEVVDRMGQMLRFECPVTKEKNAGNAAQRGGKSASRGDPLNYDEYTGGRGSRVILGDAACQSIILEAVKDGERVLIKSGNTPKDVQTDPNAHQLELSVAKGTVRLECFRENQERISFELDSVNQVATLKAPIQTVVDSPNTRFTGSVQIDGNLSVGGNINCSGSVRASGSIMDGSGNTNHHGH